MTELTEKAKKLLLEGDFTLVACSENETVTSSRRGVKPLLDMLDEGRSLKGFEAADRVVGRAAAFLYVLLSVESVHADIISEPAKKLLSAAGVSFSYDELVPVIINRTNTGLCPMESAVMDIDDPAAAEKAIRETLAKLMKNK